MEWFLFKVNPILKRQCKRRKIQSDQKGKSFTMTNFIWPTAFKSLVYMQQNHFVKSLHFMPYNEDVEHENIWSGAYSYNENKYFKSYHKFAYSPNKLP